MIVVWLAPLVLVSVCCVMFSSDLRGHIARWWRRTPPPDLVLRELQVYAELAQCSYENPTLERREVGLDLFHYTLDNGASHGGRLWLWTHRTSGTRVLVIRGSHVLEEWAADLELVKAAAGWRNSFDTIIEQYRKHVDEVLRDANHAVVFVGHSLGAAIAEAIYWLRIRESPHRNDYSAVTFDSPGQPESWRIANGMTLPLPRLTTLNSTANFVNMLFRPAASAFYSCGNGSRVTPNQLCAWITTAFKEPILRAVTSGVVSHPMSVIIVYLGRREVSRDHPDHWPLISAKLLASISELTELIKTLSTAAPPKAVSPPATRPAEALPRNSTQTDGIPELPPTIADLEICQPYEISEKHWERFFTFLSDDDILIPIFGATGVGKTSTVCALLRDHVNKHKYPIAEGSNNSRVPLVAWYDIIDWDDGKSCGRIFLLDMPGYGGPKEQSDNYFLHAGLEPLLALVAKSRKACAAFVLGENLHEHHIQQHEKLRQRFSKIIYWHSVRAGRPDEAPRVARNLQHDYRKRLQLNGDNMIVSYQPYPDVKNEKYLHVGPLREQLAAFIGHNKLSIRKTTEVQRKQSEGDAVEQEASRQLGFLFRNVNFYGSFAVAGVATWMPGVPVWTALCGTVGPFVVLPVIGTIGVVPTATALGVAGAYTLLRNHRLNSLRAGLRAQSNHAQLLRRSKFESALGTCGVQIPDNARERLARLCLCYLKVPGDGNCFYQAVAFAVNRPREDIRSQLALHIEGDENLLREMNETGEWSRANIHALHNEGEWATEPVLIAFARRYKQRLIVVAPGRGLHYYLPTGSRVCGSLPPDDLDNDVWIYYNGVNHYDAFIRIM